MSKKPAKRASPELVELSLATHPTGSVRIAKIKGWGGLIAFVLIGWLSLRAGLPAAEVAARALVGGVAGYVVAWAAGVSILRLVIESQLRAERDAREEQMRHELDADLMAYDPERSAA